MDFLWINPNKIPFRYPTKRVRMCPLLTPPGERKEDPSPVFSIFTGCMQDCGELLSDPQAEGPAAVWELRPWWRHQHGGSRENGEKLVMKQGFMLLIVTVVRGCERLGVPAVRHLQTPNGAEMGGASRPDPKCDRRESVQQHVGLAARASSELSWTRDSFGFRHTRKKGTAPTVPSLTAGKHSFRTTFIISPPTLSFQLNTDVENHVRSMSTRQRLPSKSTEDVSQRNNGFIQTQCSCVS